MLNDLCFVKIWFYNPPTCYSWGSSLLIAVAADYFLSSEMQCQGGMPDLEGFRYPIMTSCTALNRLFQSMSDDSPDHVRPPMSWALGPVILDQYLRVFAGWTASFTQLFWGSLLTHRLIIAVYRSHVWSVPPHSFDKPQLDIPAMPWSEETHMPSQDHGFAGAHPLSKLEPVGTNGKLRRGHCLKHVFVSKCWTPGSCSTLFNLFNGNLGVSPIFYAFK